MMMSGTFLFLISLISAALFVAAAPANYNWSIPSTPFTVSPEGEYIPPEEQSYGREPEDFEATNNYRQALYQPNLEREYYLYPGNHETMDQIPDPPNYYGQGSRPPALPYRGGPPQLQYGGSRPVGPDPRSQMSAGMQRPPSQAGRGLPAQGAQGFGRGGSPYPPSSQGRLPPHIEAQMKLRHDRH